jgi:hypothetical protein
MPRTYDLAGNVTAWNNGAGRWFYVGIDAAGRANSLTTVPLPQIIDATLVSGVTHSPVGEATTELGNGAEVRFTYHNRMRASSYRLATSPGAFSYLDAWNVACDKNGNVLTGGDQYHEQSSTYTYGNLNRLSTVASTNGQGCLYTFDSFGNRTSESPQSGQCFNSSCVYNGNRISTPGFQYDDVDAEKLARYARLGPEILRPIIDEDGQRVSIRSVDNNGVCMSRSAAGNLTFDGTYTYGYDAEAV